MGAASSFNGNIGTWNVSNVMNMSGMFNEADTFNDDISNWNVTNVISMEYMFHSAFSFNSNISGWNVCNVVNMSSLFESATSFNIDITPWDIRNVQFMERMFKGATSFDQKVCWDTNRVKHMNMIFKDSDGSFLPFPQCDNSDPTRPSSNPSNSNSKTVDMKDGDTVFIDANNKSVTDEILQKKSSAISKPSTPYNMQKAPKESHMLGYFFLMMTIFIIATVMYYRRKIQPKESYDTRDNVLPVMNDLEMDII